MTVPYEYADDLPGGGIDPELGRNGLYDLQPTADLTVPALREHFAKRRAKTRAAIARGLEKCFLGADVTPAVDAVLASLEKMWRDDETFS